MTTPTIVSGAVSTVTELGKDEAWLQGWLKEQPTRLGLGELSVTDGASDEDAERSFSATDDERCFTVDVQLGEMEASRGFGVLDNWARNRVRYPDKTHVAALVTEAIDDRYRTTLETLAESEEIDADALMNVRKTVDYYRVAPELSSEPEKVKPKNKTADSITGREAREKHVPRKMTEGMIELVVNIGKRNQLSEEGLSELINGCGSTIQLGRINIVDMQTYFEVSYPLSHEIINHFKRNPTEFGGRLLNVAFAGNAKPARE